MIEIGMKVLVLFGWWSGCHGTVIEPGVKPSHWLLRLECVDTKGRVPDQVAELPEWWQDRKSLRYHKNLQPVPPGAILPEQWDPARGRTKK